MPAERIRHYCTLFDSRYLPQGLVLYDSLLKHSSEPFKLHILPLDEVCHQALLYLKLENVAIWNREPFERTGLQDGRTWAEWCWTLASIFSEQVMSWLRHIGIQDVTYLDADMMFFSDSEVIHKEIGDRSIAVIPHRFIPEKRYLEVNGKFNVSWVTFKNDDIAQECLRTWAWQCRRKCSATDECGDQKYLDAWPDKYGRHLAIIENIGAGLAPWNLANYRLLQNGQRVDLADGTDDKPVVFYHYHEFAENADGSFRLTNYRLRPEDIQLIYEPYLEAYKAAQSKVQSIAA